METHLPNKLLHALKKKVMWLCAKRRDNLTSSGPISFTASKSCYGHSEKPEKSLSLKFFCIIVLHDCVLKQLASSSERSDNIYCITSARSEVKVIYIIHENDYIQMLLQYS